MSWGVRSHAGRSSTRQKEDTTMAALENISYVTIGALYLNQTEKNNTVNESHTSFIIAAGFILFTSFIGILGNSLVFWYLSFKIKRTKYTTYIINLAVADLIYLIFMSVVMSIAILRYLKQNIAADPKKVIFGLEILLDFGQYADMFLLTAVSVERCMAIYYPMWYRYRRPKFQSLLVCVICWGLSMLATLVDNIGCPVELFVYICISINSTVNPFIYFLVGTQKMHGAWNFLEKALKKVFGEEEGEKGVTKHHEEGSTKESNIS
ncbi:hypothetical protein NDU88_007147 [Pleurodeles waltl]|uniref:G-protein coupled receptors family 1 profile domain-containing protein n=1 Tax=Pleurodeles waltl TaxID=8319 RepID=A0AAV7SRG9_PLEWA|nr:hypothetical protein NDU88_007147 [Pleurodeles waltl]